MAKWEKVKLGEIATITSSKRIFAKEYQTEGIPFYRGKEIIEKHNGNNVSTELYITRERYEEIKSKFDVPKPGDILLSSVGTLGVSWLVDEEEFYFKDGNLTWLRCNEKTISKFLYLWLNSPEAQNQIDLMCIGSTQKALTIEVLNKFDVSLPPLNIQKKICEVVYPLTDKIKTNTVINRNLSEQAQAIYESWFVSFEKFGGVVPLDWEDGVLGDIAEIKTTSFKPDKEPDVIVEHYSIPALDEKHFPVFELAEGIKSNKYLLNKNSVMISKLNPDTKRIWRPLCLSDKPVCSTEFIVFEAKNKKNKDFIFSILDSDKFSNHLCSHVTGSTGSRQRAVPKATLDFKVLIPPQELIEQFCSIVTPIYDSIGVNEIENQRLSELRDSLLPKLMSGELDVSDLDI